MKKINFNFPIYSISNFNSNIKNKKNIIDTVLKNKKYKNEGYNYPILEDYDNFFQNLYESYYNICLNKFNLTVNKFKNKSIVWAYVSDKINFNEVWHNHLITSTINGVYYLNIPENNTSIDFELNNNEFTYHPQENELLIFPNYLNHKPNRCYGDGYRICMNMEIICNETSEELFDRIDRYV